MTEHLFHHTDSDGDQFHVGRGHSAVLYLDTSANNDTGTQVRLYPAEVRQLWSALGEWLGTVEGPERVQKCMAALHMSGDRMYSCSLSAGHKGLHQDDDGDVWDDISGVQDRHERTGPGEYGTLITAVESMHATMRDLLTGIRDRLPERVIQCGDQFNDHFCSKPSGHEGSHGNIDGLFTRRWQ